MVSDQTNHNRRSGNEHLIHSFYHRRTGKLLQFKAQGLKQIEIAQKLGRSRSSVSRKLKRNSREGGSYSAFEAEGKYRWRRKRCVRKRRLDNEELKKYVTEKLHDYWSPEQIDGRLKLEHSSFQISFATIYRAVHNGDLDIPKKCLRHGGRKPFPYKDETRGRLHGHKTIHTVSLQDFQAVVHSLNTRPRKRLGFRSPAECFPLMRLLLFT